MKSLILVVCLFLAILLSTIWVGAFGQELNPDTEKIILYSDSMLQNGIKRKLTPGVAIAIVNRDSLIYLKGFGTGNEDHGTPIDPNSSIFQVGSVGKIFTLISVLQQIDQGNLALDKDVTHYVPEIPIDNTFKFPITLKDLLTHSAGLDDRLIGYAARTQNEIVSLEAHLVKRFPRRYIEPGREISYSNYGYALAGYLVEKTSGEGFNQYVEKRILDALGMSSSGYYTRISKPGTREKVVQGYTSKDEGFEKVDDFFRNPVPAGGIYTTAKDMSVFMEMILHQGRSGNIVIYDSSWQNQMATPQISHHPWLTGYTLGFEEQNFNGIHAIAKGGTVPGFTSEIVLFPKEGLGIFLVTNVSQDALLEEYMNGFVDRFVIKKNLFPTADKAFDVYDYTGWYRINRHNRHDIEDLFELFQGQVHITSPESGTLQLYHDGDYHSYKPINDTIFQNVDDPNRLMVFFRKNGKVIAMANGFKVGGILVPAKYEKLAWIDTNDFLNEWLGVVVLILLSFTFALIWRLILLVIRKNKPGFLKNKLLPGPAYYSGLLFSVLTFIWIAFYFIAILKNPTELIFGMPSSLKIYHLIPFLQIACLMVMFYSLLKIFQRRNGLLVFRLYYLIFVFSSFFWMFILDRWHFIGFNY